MERVGQGVDKGRLGQTIFPRFWGPLKTKKSLKIDEIYIKNSNFINGESKIVYIRRQAIFPRFFGPSKIEKSPKIDEIY